jgi:hypothetical protein
MRNLGSPGAESAFTAAADINPTTATKQSIFKNLMSKSSEKLRLRQQHTTESTFNTKVLARMSSVTYLVSSRKSLY